MAVLDAYRLERQRVLQRLGISRRHYRDMIEVYQREAATIREAYWTPERVEAWYKARRTPYLTITCEPTKPNGMSECARCGWGGDEAGLTKYHIEWPNGPTDTIVACSEHCLRAVFRL